MKNLGKIVLSAMLITVLGACQKDETTANTTEKKEVQSENVAKDSLVIKGTGAHRLTSDSPTIILDKGKATLKVKVKGADKSNEFSATIIERLENGGSATGLSTVSGKGNLSDSESFEVPAKGTYDINLSSDPDFKGEWEVVIEQKAKKDKDYDKQLRVSKITQQVGGEFVTSILEKKEGYGSLVSNFTILDKNSISFQSLKNENFVITELKDGKWTKKEKETGETKGKIQKFREEHSGARIIVDNVKTTKGPAELLSHGEKYYLLYENVSSSPEEVTVPKELVSLFKTGLRDVYWDFDKKVIYTVFTNTTTERTDKAMLYRYDLKKQEFILDAEGKKKTFVPLEQSSSKMRFASDKKGNLYIVAPPKNVTNSKDAYSVTVAVFNKDMKLLANPTKVHAIYDYYDTGAFEVSATDTGLDIWNVYDSSTVNGGNTFEPLKVGVNRFSLELK